MFRCFPTISILYAIFSIVRSQCDSDILTVPYLNSSNPYCTHFQDDECVCCGYADDNLFNYESMCVVGTQNDVKQGENIMKSTIEHLV